MKKFFFENFGIKVASVIMAIILWFFVTSKGQSELSMDVPIELKNMPHGLESVKQSAKTATISIKGQERLLKNIRPSDVMVYVDLSKAKKGKGSYYLGKDDVKHPSTTAVTSINPTSVWVVLGETVVRTVPVQAVVTGNPKAGFSAGSVEISPKSVVIEGVRSEMSGIKSIKTDPIDISDLSETLVQDARLDTAGRNIRTDTQDVRVKITIKGERRK